MKFLVKPFVLYQTPQHCYCYTQKASAKITNANLVQLLQFLLQEKRDELTQIELETLCSAYSLDFKAVVAFLIENLRIMTQYDENRFTHLYILSDNKQIAHALYDEFNKHYGLSVHIKQDFTPLQTEKSLIVLFNQVYTENQFKDLYALSDSTDTYFLSSFLADKFLIIDNIYNKTKGVPCHFCGINQLRTTTKTSPDIQNFSWLVFYRNLLKDGSPLMPAIPLTKLTESLVIHSLGSYIKQYVDPHARELLHDHTSEFWHIDLEKNRLERESSMHWLMCDCVSA